MIGGRARLHNDRRHTEWMESVAGQALQHRPGELLDGPLRLTVDVYVLRPKSVKREYPVGRPDLSNYVKAIEDALNRVIWTDDSRVVELVARKLYGDPPRVDILIEEV